MTTKKIIEGITDWVQEAICGKIELKVPDDNANDDGYNIKRVHPVAFPLYLPAKDRIPPGIVAPIPSITVQMMEGSDNIKDKERKMKIRLCLATWNPGKHSGETMIPTENPNALGGYSYTQESTTEEMYQRNGDGWKDLYNFQDVALSALESTQFIAGARISQDDPVNYGPFIEDGTIWDYYPYWHGWISFTIICGTGMKTPDTVRELLD